MEATTVLEHALFRLTPTRTRCDLLAVGRQGGAAAERIASGLVQPFLSHLRAARDQIPKGGYSFTLRPPVSHPSWFTKATLERFVRFVATPEILERVVTIEKEILQIDESVHVQREDLILASAAGTGSAKKPPSKGNEDDGKGEAVQEENSKICLVRVLENRKMMLEKEQGMAYARASVAGFDKGNIDDLISFADAFGADRLREACINFKEVCKEKEQDKLWMDELAALEASRATQLSYTGASGITLASEVNIDGQHEQNGADDSTRTSIANGSGSIPWNSSPYMYNFQNSGTRGSAPFPGYAFPFPGMQVIPPYSGYPENFHWFHHGEEKDVDGGRSCGVPEKLHRSAETTRSSRDEYSDNESSNSGSEPDEYHVSTDVDSSKRNHRSKKSKKKSSRTVVIRNINYISSKGRHEEDGSSDDSSAEDDLIDGDSLKRQVEDIVGSFGKHQSSSRHLSKKKGGKRHSGVANVLTDNDENKVMDDDNDSAKVSKKTGGGWDAFQNILMREDSHSDVTVQQNTDVLIGGTNLQQGDIAGEYCLSKNGKTAPSSMDKYQLQDEIARGTKPKIHAADPLVGGKMGADYAGNGRLENFEYTESNGRVIKRIQNAGEDFLIADRAKLEMVNNEVLSNTGEESSRFRGRRDGDWFLVSGSDGNFAREGSCDHVIFEGEQSVRTEHKNVQKEKILDVAVDDSFIAPSRVVEVEQQSFSLLETDINIISGAATTGSNGNATNQSKETRKREFHEPEELQLMLERHTEAEDVHASWTPEIEYTVDITHATIKESKAVLEASDPVNDKKPSGTKATKTKTQAPLKSIPLNKSVTKNKLDALSRPTTISTLSRKGSTISKAEKEEAERRRIEELQMQREKRIAQRSASMGRMAAPKLSGTERKMSMGKSPASQPNKQHGFGYGPKFSQPKGVANKS